MELHDVKDWIDETTCVPTALAAITGLSIATIVDAINEVARAENKAGLDRRAGRSPGRGLAAARFAVQGARARGGVTA